MWVQGSSVRRSRQRPTATTRRCRQFGVGWRELGPRVGRSSEALTGHRKASETQASLFALFGDPQHSITDQVLGAYKYRERLDGEYDESVWAHLAGTASAPFEPGDNRKIAVKVIDDRGNELLGVKEIA